MRLIFIIILLDFSLRMKLTNSTHKNHVQFWGSLALSGALLTKSLLAQASENAPADNVALDTFVIESAESTASPVEALKSSTPIIDVPQSLSIITEERIREQGFDSIGDIVDYTPGVNNSQGEGHRDAVIFRGVRSTADFFIDGVRDDVQYYRPLYNIEQIEILRGPNALLFGRGGTGGILNRVTKKGVIGENFTTLSGRIDTFGAYSTEIDSNYTAGESAAIRFNFLYEELNNHRDFFDGERIGFNPTAKFKLGDFSTLDVSYEYVDHERFIDRGIPTGANGSPVEAFKDIVFADPEQNIDELEAHLFRALLQHEFSNGIKGRLSGFYGNYDKLYQNVYPSGYDAINTPDRVTLDGYVDTTQRENYIFSGDLRGEFETGKFNHKILTGFETIFTENNNDRFNTFFDQTNDDNETFLIERPLNFNNNVGVNANGQTTTNDYTADINDDTEADVQVYSLFVQDEIEISEKLDLILGARFDRFDIEVLNSVNNETRSRTDDEISPRAGIVFKPQENISFYGSYSESFLPRSGEQFASINGNDNQLDPDTFTNLEVGVKWDFERLSLTAALFQIEQSSPQVSDNDPSTLDVIDSEINGFEAQIQGQITDNWYISAGYTYLDGEQVDRSGPTGLRPRELPKHAFSVWNNYRVTEKFGLGLGLIYQDESFINNSNSATLPSYYRVDAAAYYQFSDNLRIQLNIENLTDELYFPYSHSTHQASVGAPINAALSVRWTL